MSFSFVDPEVEEEDEELIESAAGDQMAWEGYPFFLASSPVIAFSEYEEPSFCKRHAVSLASSGDFCTFKKVITVLCLCSSVQGLNT